MTKPNSVEPTSVDGFLDNSFKVIQPKSGAHRSGMDAVLLAAALPKIASGSLADFGAGCGVAGMAVAQRCEGITVDLVEIDAACLAFSQNSLNLPENAHLRSRISILQADLCLFGAARITTGLAREHYDHIIANPPYNSATLQPSPDKDRARAHAMDDGLWQAWVKTAAYAAKPKATLTFIIRPQSLGGMLSALGQRFGSVRVLPIHAKSGADSNRLIVQANKGGNAPLKLLSGFVIHDDDGSFSAQADVIFRGRAALSL